MIPLRKQRQLPFGAAYQVKRRTRRIHGVRRRWSRWSRSTNWPENLALVAGLLGWAGATAGLALVMPGPRLALAVCLLSGGALGLSIPGLGVVARVLWRGVLHYASEIPEAPADPAERGEAKP